MAGIPSTEQQVRRRQNKPQPRRTWRDDRLPVSGALAPSSPARTSYVLRLQHRSPMALISCADCGGSVSSRAAVCPRCGCPVDKRESATIGGGRPPQSEMQIVAKDWTDWLQHDPTAQRSRVEIRCTNCGSDRTYRLAQLHKDAIASTTEDGSGIFNFLDGKNPPQRGWGCSFFLTAVILGVASLVAGVAGFIVAGLCAVAIEIKEHRRFSELRTEWENSFVCASCYCRFPPTTGA